MMNDAATKGSMLVGVKVMTSQFATSHPADSVNEISPKEIFKPVLVWIVGVGPTMEVGCGRVLHPILIMGILKLESAHVVSRWDDHLHGTLPR